MGREIKVNLYCIQGVTRKALLGLAKQRSKGFLGAFRLGCRFVATGFGWARGRGKFKPRAGVLFGTIGDPGAGGLVAFGGKALVEMRAVAAAMDVAAAVWAEAVFSLHFSRKSCPTIMTLPHRCLSLSFEAFKKVLRDRIIITFLNGRGKRRYGKSPRQRGHCGVMTPCQRELWKSFELFENLSFGRWPISYPRPKNWP